MKRNPLLLAAITLLFGRFNSQAQFTNADWPSTINPNASVDYAVFDPGASFPSTPSGWFPGFSLSGGGDQAFSLVTLDSLKGNQGSSSFMNLADNNYAQFATVPNVDILLQVFG